MNGHHEGRVLYVIRNQVDQESCALVTAMFEREVQKNGGNRTNDDFVQTNQIGATQFSRNGKQYTDEVLRVGPATADLLANVSDNEIEKMFLTIFLENHFLVKAVHFGAARHKSGHSSFATFRRWLDNGAMSLMPHEDLAQLEFAKEDDFEIAQAKTVTSYNICLEASEVGGELQIWNLIPDNECREAYDVTRTGYPYPLEDLTDVESVSVRLRQGDIYFMNACKLHGVRSVVAGKRLTAGRFIGRVSDRKVVYWT